MNKQVTILAIETSCDDTSVAVSINDNILANVVSSQHIHEIYGGVVPELASRAHLQHIVKVSESALKKANILLNDVDAIAYTRGPGLLGSLLVGSSFAKALAVSLKVPLIEVNHTEAHILAHFIAGQYSEKPEFPMLCLTVSGGHTQLVEVSDFLSFNLIGQTIDDAAGEAFDKGAKLLGLPYPGGALIEKLAAQHNGELFKLAQPRIPELDFSFSGLKTSFLYLINENAKSNPEFLQNEKNKLASSLQAAIVEHLIDKTQKALQSHAFKSLSVAGGVSANSYLRQKLVQLAESFGLPFYAPALQYCTDNAGMIAIAGYYKYLASEFTTLSAPTQARMPIAKAQK